MAHTSWSRCLRNKKSKRSESLHFWKHLILHSNFIDNLARTSQKRILDQRSLPFGTLSHCVLASNSAAQKADVSLTPFLQECCCSPCWLVGLCVCPWVCLCVFWSLEFGVAFFFYRRCCEIIKWDYVLLWMYIPVIY